MQPTQTDLFSNIREPKREETLGERSVREGRVYTKDIQETTLDAFDVIKGTLGKREHTVISGLARYMEKSDGFEPTAYELFEYLKSARTVFDINSVRPRLTRMQERDMRLVVKSATKRKCSISGKNAWTWNITERGRLYLAQPPKGALG